MMDVPITAMALAYMMLCVAFLIEVREVAALKERVKVLEDYE